ncbi:nucleotide-binding universal stress UspA family protein [Maribacter caenipelagi]|uniref:Nucleotide-binding universal stress UspA family protein n=1 Tax=Maribacter caenipelagi TaxID=1447781 RepID=A0A4R7D1Q7_9FLAO|nr:universal stress protein [Maribacter caenipelagi]TDS14182.1 nucleotide-binding universal stress UspA family protein [Maribacter caenipelagi]
MNIKNILVATDFSNEAYNALYYATQIFASKQCTFHIIHAYDDMIVNAKNVLFTGQKELEKLQTTSQDNLTKTVHKIVLDTGNKLHKFNTISVKGSLPSVISKTIESHEIDLVVLGNKGKTGAKELFMGSNTIQIANTITTCPILAIPKEIAFKPIEEIAFVTDYKKGCTKSTISMLLNIANITDASIAVLHINEEEIMTPKQVSNQKLLDKCLVQTPHSYDEIWNYADKANVIQDFIAEREINMLAMSYHRRKFFERFLHEPVIMDLSIYATIPFLILPVQD